MAENALRPQREKERREKKGDVTYPSGGGGLISSEGLTIQVATVGGVIFAREDDAEKME